MLIQKQRKCKRNSISIEIGRIIYFNKEVIEQ